MTVHASRARTLSPVNSVNEREIVNTPFTTHIPISPVAFVHSVHAVHAPRQKAKADRITAYDESNADAAALILADPQAHGGADGLPVRWAWLVTGRQRPKQTEGVLFDAEVHNGPTN